MIIDFNIEAVDPLPFVPAMWITVGSFFSSNPICDKSLLILNNDKSENFGWSFSNLLKIGSFNEVIFLQKKELLKEYFVILFDELPYQSFHVLEGIQRFENPQVIVHL